MNTLVTLFIDIVNPDALDDEDDMNDALKSKKQRTMPAEAVSSTQLDEEEEILEEVEDNGF